MPENHAARGSVIDLNSRLSPDDTFCFACGPEVPCFTDCCGKLELLLTPYDAMRLASRLAISSSDFLDRYGLIRRRTDHGFPEIMMRMDPTVEKLCPFVTTEGCSVYEDRPGACRIYPLGRAATRSPLDGAPKEFYFTVREQHCRGFEQPKAWTVREWIEDQGIVEYNRFNDLLMDLYVLKSRRKGVTLGQQQMRMFIMSCYNLEKFRQFIFKSGFLRKFDIDSALVNALRSNDTKLLEFAFRWLKFALFQEPTLKIR